MTRAEVAKVFDTANLRLLAGAASPGPWKLCEHGSVSHPNGWVDAVSADRYSNGNFVSEQQCRDAAYIAAANPQAVIELLDEIEQARSLLAEMVSLHDESMATPFKPGFLGRRDAVLNDARRVLARG